MDQIVRPSRSEVEAAFRTIIRWTGDDPDRDGLVETPQRMARAYEEYFQGYGEDPEAILSKTFEEIEGYDEMIVLRGIRFESHCEHHMAPIIGRAYVAYIPNGRVVGISKLARIVEVYAKRLQIQEKMTAQIANAIDNVLQPQGVGVVLKAEHFCMTARGIMKPGTDLVTSRMLGVFRDSADHAPGVHLAGGLRRRRRQRRSKDCPPLTAKACTTARAIREPGLPSWRARCDRRPA